MKKELPDLPMDPEYSKKLTQLVETINGFVYSGDRLNAILDTLKALRANPDLASVLLGTEPIKPEPEEEDSEQLSTQDWVQIFSVVPPYPLELPDEARRNIAGLAIIVRQAAETMERGRRNNDQLLYFMALSLISSAVKRLEEWAP